MSDTPQPHNHPAGPVQAPVYVEVAVATPLRTTFTYRVAGPQLPRRGARVTVPFGRQKLNGIITETNVTPDIEPKRVRTIITIFDQTADIPEPLMQLCHWTASYYHYPIGEVFATALPLMLRQGWDPSKPEQELQLSESGLSQDETTLKRAPAQLKMINLLKVSPRTRQELKDTDISARTIKTLIDKQWVKLQARALKAPTTTWQEPAIPSDLSTTAEQAAVIQSLVQQANRTYLLQGITGSGKTEIYLQFIEHVLKAGKQALILVPEIGLTPQTIHRFRARFQQPMIILHSAMTDRERAEGWYAASQGHASIVLGTRSAIFTPLKNPGAIVVDEEHDASYKQQDGLRYSARDLAVLRGQFEKVSVVLGSATPSLESLHNVETGKYKLLTLKERPPGTNTEHYEMINTRHLEMTEGFTRGLRQKISTHLSQAEQVLVFINRRGFAPVLLCQECGWIAQCRRCDARMTVHIGHSSLICHHCGALSHNLANCQSCNGNRVAPIGFGTQRIEKTLEQFYPDFPVIRIDRDSTRRKHALGTLLAEVNKGQASILVGTQLLAKGHHFPNVTLVALLDVDAGFYSSDFRAMERLGQLVLQVGGRAGRADKPGTVVIQSAFADHPLLHKLTSQGYSAFAADLLAERREHDLPPYSFQAIIRAESADARAAQDFLEAVAGAFESRNSVQLLGPIPALMERKAGRYRQLLVITSDRRSHLHAEIEARAKAAESAPEAKKVRWAIDVDPIDLF